MGNSGRLVYIVFIRNVIFDCVYDLPKLNKQLNIVLISKINAYHGDSSACMVRDGQLVAAAEEERFRRIKHWAGLPTEAIQYCLREGGVEFKDLDHIGINRKPGVNNWPRLFFAMRQRRDADGCDREVGTTEKLARVMRADQAPRAKDLG